MSIAAKALKDAASESTKKGSTEKSDPSSPQPTKNQHNRPAGKQLAKKTTNPKLKAPKPTKPFLTKKPKSSMERLIDAAKRGASSLGGLQDSAMEPPSTSPMADRRSPFPTLMAATPPASSPTHHQPMVQELTTSSQTMVPLMSTSLAPTLHKDEKKSSGSRSLSGLRPVGIGGYTLKEIGK